jgi:hypothetical protein
MASSARPTADAEALALAVDDTDVYWLEIDATLMNTELWRAPKDGSGQPQRLLTSDLIPSPEALTTLKLTADEIYWIGNCAFVGGNGGDNADGFILGMAKP